MHKPHNGSDNSTHTHHHHHALTPPRGPAPDLLGKANDMGRFMMDNGKSLSEAKKAARAAVSYAILDSQTIGEQLNPAWMTRSTTTGKDSGFGGPVI